MVVMILTQSLMVASGSASGFVLLFSFTMAFMLKMDTSVIIMTSTEAYAVVLVVFVGTMMAPVSGSRAGTLALW